MKTKLLFLFFVICKLIGAQNVNADFQATSGCFQNPTCFTDKSTSTNGPITQWYWNFGDGITTSAIQNPCHTYGAAGTYTVTLIAVNSNGDKDTVTHSAFVDPIPVATLKDIEGCSGSYTCFTNLSTISSGTITGFSWNFGDPISGINNISQLQNPCHLYATAGTFTATLTVTSDQGCQATTIQSVPVHAPPVANFSLSQGNGFTNFTDLSTSSDGSIVSWNWTFPGGSPSTSSVQNPNAIMYPPGTYSACLTVTTSYGCNDTICQTHIVSSVNENNISTMVSIFPNPFSARVILKTEPAFEDATITICNSYGQQVKQIKNISGNTIALYRDNLPGGLYFLRLSQSDKIFETSKLVITDH